jgi:hypothetical protein
LKLAGFNKEIYECVRGGLEKDPGTGAKEAIDGGYELHRHREFGLVGIRSVH